jgi:hypothetical protein
LNLINAFGATSSVVQNVTNALLGAPNIASATIDQSSLTASNGGTFTVTGTAQNTNSVSVYMAVTSYTGGKDWQSVSQITNASLGQGVVSGGHWTVTYSDVSHPYVSYGPYTVYVYDSATKVLLTTGTLTMTGALAYANLDSTTLYTSSTVAIAGTAGNTSGVLIALIDPNYGGSSDYSAISNSITMQKTGYYLSSVAIPVSNGRWVAPTISEPSGTYEVYVYDASTKAFLTNGLLTVNSACAVGNVYATQVPGYVYSNVYIAVHGLSVLPSDIIGITGADSWNSLQFMYDSTETGTSGATILKATQTVNATGVSYITARSGNIAPSTKNGASITCSPSYKG